MKKTILLLLFFSFAFFAQKRETRAVWVATNFRLDWPPPVYDEAEQKLELDEIFRTIKKKNCNTVYFQTVVKGTALYRSRVLPFCPYVSGFGGEEPTYDPLRYAVSLARQYGLEIHAWINAARVFSGDEYEFLNLPQHVTRLHPDWIVIYGYGRDASYWLDFGIPEAREFVISAVKEIAENYDVDGIQFDFLRYPGKNFADAKTYAAFGDSLSLDDWRRENINAFMKEAFDTLKSVKPFMKVGAAPFGIYKNIPGAKGGESFSLVYQDSRKWLRQGWVDYLVPQIYWNINDNPRFDSLACNWTRNSFGKNIVLGVAAYKPDVIADKSEIISLSRKCDAAGLAFFRYKFIENVDFPEFDKFVYPKEMPWIDSSVPLPPGSFAVNFAEDAFELRWSKSQSPVKYYSLYDITAEPILVALFPADANFARMRIRQPKAVINRFELRAVNQLWNESKQSKKAEVEVPQLADLINIKNTAPQKPFVFKSGKNYFLVVYSRATQGEKIMIVSAAQQKKFSLQHGTNILPVNLSGSKQLEIEFPSRNKKIKLKIK